MKKRVFSIFTVAALAITALSCSSDDNGANTSNEQNKLLGKWDYVQELALDASGNVVSTYNEDNGVCPADIFEFKKDGVLQNIDYVFTNNTNECDGDINNGTWNISGNTFKLTIGDGEESFEIKNLTNDTFEVQRPLIRDEAEDYELNVVALKFVFKKSK
ncbi:lipocalin family protein [Myroides odoratimimus]|uniref:lipocalin family protein n=1 Tax=Myroides odoratimimus TaxID=76832 RepID=UPI00257554F4|nr:lipocalin family protein [Myroides odoratimimus]MDM1328863.1 lipocalin family protein [Myroides odoratimimus]